MLSRVLRRDQVLAVLSVAGVVAGLALVILTKLKVTGIIVITSGLVAAVAIAVPKAIESLADLKERQRDQDDRIRSILVGGEPLPLADVDPFEIGVFRSHIAEESARNQGAPEYVGRTLDDALHAAFNEHALTLSRRLVVLRGDPKAGKSRTLWEAVCQLNGRRLVAVKTPIRVSSGLSQPPNH